jgi:hypothetical protein
MSSQVYIEPVFPGAFSTPNNYMLRRTCWQNIRSAISLAAPWMATTVVLAMPWCRANRCLLNHSDILAI